MYIDTQYNNGTTSNSKSTLRKRKDSNSQKRLELTTRNHKKSHKYVRERQNNKSIGQCCNIDTFNGDTVKMCSLGEMKTICNYCCAKGFHSENKGTKNLPHFGILCCNKGKIDLTPFNPLPQKLDDFFTADDSDSKHFRKNI